ncbi:MAG: GMC oxidoreductase [Parvularculaceae bacterium]
MFHTLSAVLSVTPGKTEATFPKTFAINDFYWGDPEGGFDFPMGNIQLLEYMNADTIRGQLSAFVPPDIFPKALAHLVAERIIAFLVISEDLPQGRNRVRLSDKGEIILDYWHDNLAGHERLVKKFCGKLGEMNRMAHLLSQHRVEFSEMLPLFGTAHQCGTLRMGDDPASSVVDASCKAHQLDNLYVGDTSVYVTSTAVNPTLTVVANGLRIGDHIKDRL